MCINQATVLVSWPVFSNSNEQMIYCIHFSKTHINKGPCRNISDEFKSKKDEVTFLKDAAQARGQLYERWHSKRIMGYVVVTTIVQDKSRHYIKQVKAAGLASRESFSMWLEVMTGFINASQWLRKYNWVFSINKPLGIEMKPNKIKDYSFNFWNRINHHNCKCTRL